MLCSLIIILFVVSNLKYERDFVTGHKLVYKKDFSEYCRRRVVPSVFLGRQVVDAGSQILHFSRLELPYSCFISVRSESGSNIILVIEFPSHESLTSSCAKDADQLLVYGMRDTLGGYWGPLADVLTQKYDKNETKYYTIKTTPSLDEDLSIESDEEYVETPKTTERLNFTSAGNSLSETVNYIEEVIPIVNVSGFVIPGEKSKSLVDADNFFDEVYDVSSGSGMSYDTTVLPLIQFSERTDIGARPNEDILRQQNIDSLPIDINIIYPKTSTPKTKKLYRKYKYDTNKLMNFKANHGILESMRKLSHLHKFSNSQQLSTSFGIYQGTKLILTTLTSKFPPLQFNTEKTFSWDIFDTILKSFNKTTESKSDEENSTIENRQEQLLREISERKHNFSVYLTSNLSTYGEKFKALSSYNYITSPIVDNFSISQLNILSVSDVLLSESNSHILIENSTQSTGSASYENITKSYVNTNLETKSQNSTLKTIILNETSSSIEVSDSSITLNNTYATEKNILLDNTNTDGAMSGLIYRQPLRGSLVNRESWDNIVQIAPVMADVLSEVQANKSEIKKMKNMKRKKKHINSISIDIAKPYAKTPRKKMSTVTISNTADTQELAQLVELQDDEMQGRVALRYIQRYVGPILFNVCNYEEVLTRHVYLLNSSRIVLAINNFTIDKMSLIATPAQTLLTSEERCTSTQFECQVSGTRICIDSMTACDGIPNCGSYDIYDEDRLMCGAAEGLQHSVTLAALTFLAVLLTLIYIIHYWLKRCVPKVSDAFFIYTEGFDNMLYLDTIMKNPNEDDDILKHAYQTNIFEDDLLCPIVHEISKKRRILKVIKNIITCCFFLNKEDKNDKMSKDNFNSSFTETKKIYSFTELEIQKMLCNNLTETGVQTGDSLQMKPLHKNPETYGHIPDKKHENSKKLKNADSLLFLTKTSNTKLPKPKPSSDELNIIKFINDSKQSPCTSQTNVTLVQIASNDKSATPEEQEIQSHSYEPQRQIIPARAAGGVILTNVDVHEEKTSATKTKHLRFEEGATLISTDEYKKDDTQNVNKNRRSVILGMGKSGFTPDLDAIEEANEQHSSGNSGIRFWSKKKRPKK